MGPHRAGFLKAEDTDKAPAHFGHCPDGLCRVRDPRGWALRPAVTRAQRLASTEKRDSHLAGVQFGKQSSRHL